MPLIKKGSFHILEMIFSGFCLLEQIMKLHEDVDEGKSGAECVNEPLLAQC